MKKLLCAILCLGAGNVYAGDLTSGGLMQGTSESSNDKAAKAFTAIEKIARDLQLTSETLKAFKKTAQQSNVPAWEKFMNNAEKHVKDIALELVWNANNNARLWQLHHKFVLDDSMRYSNVQLFSKLRIRAQRGYVNGLARQYVQNIFHGDEEVSA